MEENKYVKNIPDVIHLMLDDEREFDEDDETLDFDKDFNHECTYWAQGESNADSDINYILKSKYDELEGRLKIALDSHDMLSPMLKDKEARIKELEEVMQEFCDRRDKGELKSTYTYEKFKRLLTQTK